MFMMNVVLINLSSILLVRKALNREKQNFFVLFSLFSVSLYVLCNIACSTSFINPSFFVIIINTFAYIGINIQCL